VRSQLVSAANQLMLFLLAFNLLLAFLFSNVNVPFIDFFDTPWFLVVAQVLGLLLPFLLFSSVGERVTIERERLDFANVVLIVAISLLLQPFMMFVSGLASLVMPNPVEGLIADLLALPVPAALVIIALTPAVCEELVFRGFIQSRYAGQPLLVTALVNGLFFAMIHFSLHQFAYAFLMGIVFVYMVHFTRSIYSAMLSHFVINASQFLLARAASGVETDESVELIEALFAIGRLALFVLPLLLALGYCFVKRNYRGKEIFGKHPLDLAFAAVVILYLGLVVFIL